MIEPPQSTAGSRLNAAATFLHASMIVMLSRVRNKVGVSFRTGLWNRQKLQKPGLARTARSLAIMSLMIAVKCAGPDESEFKKRPGLMSQPHVAACRFADNGCKRVRQERVMPEPQPEAPLKKPRTKAPSSRKNETAEPEAPSKKSITEAKPEAPPKKARTKAPSNRNEAKSEAPPKKVRTKAPSNRNNEGTPTLVHQKPKPCMKSADQPVIAQVQVRLGRFSSKYSFVLFDWLGRAHGCFRVRGKHAACTKHSRQPAADSGVDNKCM